MGSHDVASFTFHLDVVWSIYHKAMMVHNRRLILVSPFQQPRKHMRSIHIWKTVTTVTLWVLWKCRCSRLYDATNLGSLDVLLEIWETLLTVVCGHYDNMYGSPKLFIREGQSIFTYGGSCPLFVVLDQGPQWNYRVPWTLSWISIHDHGNVQDQVSTPLYKLFLYVHVLVYIQCLLFYVVSL